MFFVPLSRVTFAYLPLFSPESTAKSIDFSSRNEGKKINDRIKALYIVMTYFLFILLGSRFSLGSGLVRSKRQKIPLSAKSISEYDELATSFSSLCRCRIYADNNNTVNGCLSKRFQFDTCQNAPCYIYDRPKWVSDGLIRSTFEWVFRVLLPSFFAPFFPRSSTSHLVYRFPVVKKIDFFVPTSFENISEKSRSKSLTKKEFVWPWRRRPHIASLPIKCIEKSTCSWP